MTTLERPDLDAYLEQLDQKLADVALARRLGEPRGEYLLADAVYAHLDDLGPRLVQEMLIAVRQPVAEKLARVEQREISDYVSTVQVLEPCPDPWQHDREYRRWLNGRGPVHEPGRCGYCGKTVIGGDGQ